MQPIRFGIVGTGFIAGVIADTLAHVDAATLAAVSSRRRESAEAFVRDRPGVVPVEGLPQPDDRRHRDQGHEEDLPPTQLQAHRTLFPRRA